MNHTFCRLMLATLKDDIAAVTTVEELRRTLGAR